MTYLIDLPAAFLPNIEFLLRECGPDPDALPDEAEAIARVALRLEAWIRDLVPDGLPPCGEEGCELPATDSTSRGSVCPFHAFHLTESPNDNAHVAEFEAAHHPQAQGKPASQGTE